MFIPERCVLCEAVGSVVCPSCGPLIEEWEHDVVLVGWDYANAVLSYEGLARRAMTAAKYRNRRGFLSWLAAHMAQAVQDLDVDAITWVPSSVQGRSQRGYQPSELLATWMGRYLQLEVVGLLERKCDQPQSKRGRASRKLGPSMAVKSAAPRRLIVVDDVTTTGASLVGAARLLRASGATYLEAAVGAQTPPAA